MEKNKKLRIFIVSMSLFLVITFVATCSLTLSFFGSSKSATSTIKLGNAVEVKGSVTLSTANLYVLPSQKVEIQTTATVTSPGSGTPTPALLRARVDVVTTASSIDFTVSNGITLDGSTSYWVKSPDDGYFYLMSSNSATGTLTTINPGSSGKAVPFNLSVLVPETLTNTDNGKDYKVSVTFCAIQGILYSETNGVDRLSNTISNTRSIFNSIDNAETTNIYTNYQILGNSQPDVSPSFANPAKLTSVGEGANKTITIKYTSSSVNNYTINLAGHEPLRWLSDNTYDYIDSATGKIVRNVGYYDFKGTENWYFVQNTDSNYGSLYINQANFANYSGFTIPGNNLSLGFWCSHVPYIKSSVAGYRNRTTVGMMGYSDSSASFMFTLPTSIASSAAEWKSYLAEQYSAGTPMRLYFPINQTTEDITCPKFNVINTGVNTVAVSATGIQPSIKLLP